MRLVPVIVFVLLAMSVGVHAMTPDEIASEGNHAYSEGRFQDAARHYREILKYGIQDPRIEYNMGNAAFKLGHTGEAILHYRRAALLDPLDDEIQANLRFVEATCMDRVETPEMVAPVRLLLTLQGKTGPDRQALALLGLLWLGVIFLGWSLGSPGRWKAWHGWTIAALILSMVLAGLDRRIAFSASSSLASCRATSPSNSWVIRLPY